MATRKIKDAKDLSTNELIYFKGHAKATFMSDGKTVEDVINQIGTGGGGGITAETDPIFSASPAASITEAKKTEWDKKQDAITDLDAIRSGAEKGATALQSVPSEYVTETELTNKGYATTSALNDKVDKVSGKQLSTEDFTSTLKAKLEGLSSYDDTELSNALSTLRGDFDRLVSGDTTTAIKSFNDIIAFLDGIQDTQDLSSIIASIQQQIAGKQDIISDLATIRSGAAQGATALQSYTEKYTGTITGITMNGASKGTSGVVNLGTVITAHQDISGKADKSSLATVATSGSYNDLSNKPTIPSEQVNADWNATSGKAQILNKPTIPSAVTESTVSGWGFTKNTGTYSKPSGGIPKTDLASTVQTSLGKADTALQSYTEQYKGTVTKVKINGSEKSPDSSGVVDLGTIEGGGGGSSDSDRKEVIYWDWVEGPIEDMRPNVIYWHGSGAEVIINSFEAPPEGVESYDVFTVVIWFEDPYDNGSPFSLTLPSDVMWANGNIPDVTTADYCELSISRISDGGFSMYYAVLTPFKTVE